MATVGYVDRHDGDTRLGCPAPFSNDMTQAGSIEELQANLKALCAGLTRRGF